MSGIVGIYFLDGRPVERTDLEPMVESLAHRGPDDTGIWRRGSVGLGHRMLWTTPESLHEKLPRISDSGELVISADARIDNREELLTRLDLRRPPAEISDSDLILAAYEKWGRTCPKKLIGDFAFAIWDRPRQSLFCARDHMGVRLFYYHSSPRAFVFASEIKAILCLAEVPRRLNELQVGAYLEGEIPNKVSTFYQQILRLPPGHSLTVSPGKQPSLESYWELDPLRELHLGSDEAYAESFREVFTEAVRCRLRSAFPVGAELSGGMDSSAVVCVARKLLGSSADGKLNTFSFVFDQVPESDERGFIQAVVNQGGLEPHYIRPEFLSPLDSIEENFHYADEPVTSANLYLFTQALFPAVRQRGVRVLLDGLEGDVVVSHGFEYLPELFKHGTWGELYREIISLGQRQERPPWRVFWSRVLEPVLPEPVSDLIRKILGRPRRGDEQDYLNPDFARRPGLQEQNRAVAPRAPKGVRPSRWQHWLAISGSIEPYILEAKARAIAPFGIEPRHPFYDRRVVEFCLALPPEQKLNRGWNRMILRRALGHLYPREVCWRATKGNFTPNFEKAFLTIGRRRLEEVILEDPGTIRPYVNLDNLRRNYRELLSGRGDSDCLSMVWLAVSLALWLRQWTLDGGN